MAYRILNKLDYTSIEVIIDGKSVVLPPKGWSGEFTEVTSAMKAMEGKLILIEEVVKPVTKEKAKSDKP